MKDSDKDAYSIRIKRMRDSIQKHCTPYSVAAFQQYPDNEARFALLELNKELAKEDPLNVYGLIHYVEKVVCDWLLERRVDEALLAEQPDAEVDFPVNPDIKSEYKKPYHY